MRSGWTSCVRKSTSASRRAPSGSSTSWTATPEADVVVLDEVQRVPTLLDVVHHLIERPGPTKAPRFVSHRFLGPQAATNGRQPAGGPGSCWSRCTLHGGRTAPPSTSNWPSSAGCCRGLGLGHAGRHAGLLRRALRPGGSAGGRPRPPARRFRAFRGGRLLLRTAPCSTSPRWRARRIRAARRPSRISESWKTSTWRSGFRCSGGGRSGSSAVIPSSTWFDAGVFRSVRPAGPFDRAEEIDGGALEGLVAQHLRAWIDYSHRSASLYFWRTRSGSEVDFVVYGEDGLWALRGAEQRPGPGAAICAGSAPSWRTTRKRRPGFYTAGASGWRSRGSAASPAGRTWRASCRDGR